YSLMTNYELGIAKLISVKTHLAIDFLSGVFLAASPWLFGFADAVWEPHVVVGIIEIITSLVTRVHPNAIIGTTTTGRTTGTTTTI
ncbi:MAG TPA: SPW repeat protein, partial [Flavobacterium sp.]